MLKTDLNKERNLEQQRHIEEVCTQIAKVVLKCEAAGGKMHHHQGEEGACKGGCQEETRRCWKLKRRTNA